MASGTRDFHVERKHAAYDGAGWRICGDCRTSADGERFDFVLDFADDEYGCGEVDFSLFLFCWLIMSQVLCFI